MWAELLSAVAGGNSGGGGGGGGVYSVNSEANLSADATGGPMWGDFRSSPSYNKPAVDLSNPLHLAVIVGLVALWMFKRKG